MDGISILAQNIRVLEGFGGAEWANQTTINALGATMTAVAALAMLMLPHRLVLWPLFIITCFVATAQRVTVLSLDFNLIRILVLVGFFRLALRGEMKPPRWNTLDVLIIAFAISRTFIYTLQHLTFPALVFQAGQTFDTVGIYFLMRFLLRSERDVVNAITALAVLALPLVWFFLVEKSTGRNMFSIFGGVPEITIVRQDRLRCQGAFAHPIIAGCFWASLIPLMLGTAVLDRGRRILMLAGIAASLAIVVLTASSTPVAGVMFGVIGLAAFVLRKQMLAVRVIIFFALVSLHMVMQAPVWHLISRVSLASGSTSYFRFQLIDNAIRRVSEWALLGTKSTAHWFWGAQDVTNHFILEAVRGGMLTLVLFVCLLWVAFSIIGRVRAAVEPNRARSFFVWTVGVSLFVHITNFIGVSYFGQAPVVLFLTLAMAGSLNEIMQRETRVAVPPRNRPMASRARPQLAPAS